MLDFSSRVCSVAAQPFREQIQIESKRTHRTPDFLVQTTTESLILECKTALQLERQETRAHLQIAARHFGERGEKYLVITDQTLRQGAALRNALWLEPYRAKHFMTTEVEHTLRQAADLLLPVLPCSLGDAYIHVGNSALVKTLIASRAVHVDFSKPIDHRTILYPTLLEENQDASFFLFTRTALPLE